MKFTKHIPNAITLLNLLCGVYAIILLFDKNVEKVDMACFLIFAAVVLDFMDGFAAKMLNAYSEIGKQLDSLADMVTFGVVPGLILYRLLGWAFMIKSDAIGTSDGYFLPAFFITACAAVRLARFNISPSVSGRFVGLPSPAMACMVAALPLIVFAYPASVNKWILNEYILYSVILLLGFLMVSKFPLLNFKLESWKIKGNEMRLLLVVGSIVAIIFLKYLAAPVMFVLYLLCSFLEFYVINKKTETATL